jgi:hypothetical protein
MRTRAVLRMDWCKWQRTVRGRASGTDLCLALVVTIAALSIVADRSTSTPHTVTGTEWSAGEFIAVANEPNQQRLRMRSRNTVYEGDRAMIRPGVRVTVSYRNARKRYMLADRVRVDDAGQ